MAFTTGDTPYVPAGYQVNTSVEGEVVSQDFQLRRGVWAEGRVFDQESDKPFTGEITYYYFPNADLEKSYPGLRRAFLDGRYWTNLQGEFRVPVLPTRGILAYRYDAKSVQESFANIIDPYPRGVGAESIEGGEGTGGLRSFPTRPHYLSPVNYNRLVEVNPEDESTTVRADMPLVASKTVTIRVTDSEGKPVSNYHAYGAARMWGWQRMEGPEFEIKGLTPKESRKVFVHHRDRNLAGAAIVNQEINEGDIEITIVAAGTIQGRLIDPDGEPITDASLNPNLERLHDEENTAIWAPHPELNANPTTVPVDEEGRFELIGIVPGMVYNAWASAPRKRRGTMQSMGIGRAFSDVMVEPGETKDLGDLVVSEDENHTHGPKETATDQAKNQTVVTGQVTSTDGEPVADAHVAVIAMRVQSRRGGDYSPGGEILVEGRTKIDGTYRLTLDSVSSKTHHFANVIARTDGMAIAWKQVNLDESELEASLELSAEELIKGKLVDIEGQPAVGVQLQIRSVMKKLLGLLPSRKGVGFRAEHTPQAWFQPVVSDDAGQFTLRGVPAKHGVYIDVIGSDRFAPQEIC